jgi:PAS domain S-box-containing protein
MRKGASSSVAAFALAVTLAVAAVLLRWILDPWLDSNLALITLFGAVAIAVWFGGYRPALVTATLGYLGCAFFFIGPRGSLRGYSTADIIGLLAYILSCGILIGLAEATRRARRRARERLELLRVTFASIGDAVITTDNAARITYMNGVAARLTGWASEDAAGQPIETVFRVISEQTRRPIEHPALRALRMGTIVGLENHALLIAKDGSERPIDDCAAPIRVEGDAIAGCVLVFRDVEKRRRTEHALLRSEYELADFFENANVALHWVDRDGVIQRANQAELDLLGYERDEFIGRNVTEFHVDQDLIRDVMGRLARGETIHKQQLQLRRSDGSIRDVIVSSSALFEDGEFVHSRCFTIDITDRTRAEQSLRSADRRKNEFLATLAHELRNPLAPIRNAVQFLLMDPSQDTKTKWAREVIDRQVRQMARLLDDLLDASRIAHDKLELRREHVELSSVVRNAVETSRPVIDAGNHDLVVRLPDDEVILDADPVRLAQVFSNLLNNAAKYTEPGGHITLETLLDGEDVNVSVKDDGIGIDEETLPRIFDMFSQEKTASARAQGGLGVGLALVRGLIELHDGAVDARSEGAGHGSEFIVRLPRIVRPAVATPADGDGMAADTVSKRRLLIVDDNRDSADSLAMLLQVFGHDVRTAYAGDDAIDVAGRHRPDVILLDIGMPKLDGYEACRRIRSEPWGRRMYIIALTGWGQEDDRRRAVEAGFDHHLVKPVDPDDLTELLASLPVTLPARLAHQPD